MCLKMAVGIWDGTTMGFKSNYNSTSSFKAWGIMEPGQPLSGTTPMLRAAHLCEGRAVLDRSDGRLNIAQRAFWCQNWPRSVRDDDDDPLQDTRGGGGGGGGDDEDDEDSDQALPLGRAGIDFARPFSSDGGGAPGDKRCTCAKPGNPRPSHNGYFCRTGDSTEVSATYFCPLRQACVPEAEWMWEGPEHRPCALWSGTAWEYNSKRTPTTNSWAAPPITVKATLPMTLKAQPLEAAAESLPTPAFIESRMVGLAQLRSLTAKATATLTRLRDRAQGQVNL